MWSLRFFAIQVIGQGFIAIKFEYVSAHLWKYRTFLSNLTLRLCQVLSEVLTYQNCPGGILKCVKKEENINVNVSKWNSPDVISFSEMSL